jgi:hypothetical protein
MGKGDRQDRMVVALECLQAGAPFLFHSWLSYNQLQLFLKEISDPAAGWAEQ